MATTAKTDGRSSAPQAPELTREKLLGVYRTMLLSRRLDDKEIQLKRQNRIFFQISGAGHEAVLAAAGMVLKPGHDWFYLYYRDRALCLELGQTPAEMLYSAVGAAKDPNSGGRQMPSHWGHKALNVVSVSSPTGTQFLHAVGSAEAVLKAGALDVDGFEKDEVVLVTTGEGTTSEGEFWESLNTASNLKLPIVYLVEDNGYAISVPVEVNTAGGSISKLVTGFPDLFIQEVDGCDFMASLDVMRKAVDYARKRKGPAFVHAKVIRPYSHSLSDDEMFYRPPEERDVDAKRDPVTTFPRWLVDEGHATKADIERIQQEVDAEVQAATDDALAQEQPGPETVYQHVYSPDVDPTSEQFDTEDDPQFSGNETTMVDLLNACMKDEMRRNPKMLVFGEDVADISRSQHKGKVKGKGGVFKVTWGLQKEFGDDRVYNSPLAEANIVGRAIGLAHTRLQARGGDPVLRLHLAGVHAAARRVVDDALAIQRDVQRTGGRADYLRRLHPRRDLPLADGRGALYALPRPASHLPGHGARRQRAAAHGDPVRRPRDFPRAQAPLPPDVQQGGVSRAELHDPVRQGAHRPRGDGCDDRHIRRYRAAGVHRREPGGRSRRAERRAHRSALAVSVGQGARVRVGEEDEPRDRAV